MLDVGEADFARPEIAHHVHHRQRCRNGPVVLGAFLPIRLRILAGDLDLARDQPQMVFVVDRSEAEINFRPAADTVHAGERGHDHARQVRRIVQRLPHLAGLALAETQHAPFAFFRGDDRQVDRHFGMRAAGLMGKRDMDFVHAVLKTLQIIAGYVLDVPHLNEPLAGTVRKMWKRRRLARPEIREDQAQMLARRIGAQVHLACKARLFGRLIDAQPGAIELPAMIGAADRIVLDPAEMERRATMRAVVVDDLRATRVSAIERVIFAHDTDGFGVSGRQILTTIHGVPELPHENAAGRAGPCGREIDVRGSCRCRRLMRARKLFDDGHWIVLPRSPLRPDYSTLIPAPGGRARQSCCAGGR